MYPKLYSLLHQHNFVSFYIKEYFQNVIKSKCVETWKINILFVNVFLFLKGKHFYAVAVKCLFRVTFLAVSWHVLLYRERVFKEGEKLKTPTQTGIDDREIQLLPALEAQKQGLWPQSQDVGAPALLYGESLGFSFLCILIILGL